MSAVLPLYATQSYNGNGWDIACIEIHNEPNMPHKCKKTQCNIPELYMYAIDTRFLAFMCFARVRADTLPPRLYIYRNSCCTSLPLTLFPDSDVHVLTGTSARLHGGGFDDDRWVPAGRANRYTLVSCLHEYKGKRLLAWWRPPSGE